MKPVAKPAAMAPAPTAETKVVEVEPAHFNSTISKAQIESVASAYLTGEATQALSPHHHHKLGQVVKRLEAPAGCPENQAEWQQEVGRLMGIFIYKAALRLATECDELKISNLAVPMAIAIEKRQLLVGQPTSFNFSLKTSVSHDDLLERMKGKPAKK